MLRIFKFFQWLDSRNSQSFIFSSEDFPTKKLCDFDENTTIVCMGETNTHNKQNVFQLLADYYENREEPFDKDKLFFLYKDSVGLFSTLPAYCYQIRPFQKGVMRKLVLAKVVLLGDTFIKN